MPRLKGSALTEEHKKHISEARRGQQNTLGKHWERKDIPWNKGLKGIHLSSKTEFKKGQVPWNKGLYGYKMGKEHYRWKGGNTRYARLHYWVYQQKGKPTFCEFCGKTTGKIEWANKSQKYRRNLEDWLSLCKRCHIKYDREMKRKRAETIIGIP